MNKIKLMVSSTVESLKGERDAILHLFENHPLFEIVGAKPYISSSMSASSAIQTVNLAKECDLYLLILGEDFGYELKNGRSATQAEFEAAYHQDPTKVLVFLKRGKPDAKQKTFIEQVSQYYSGYWRVEFDYTHQLQNYVNESVLSWIKDRASFNKKVSYCEHFIREAIQLKPTPETLVFYSVRKDYIEVEYNAMAQTHSIHFERTKVFSDFWGSLYELQEDLTRWSAQW